jgi:hypothetical protein
MIFKINIFSVKYFLLSYFLKCGIFFPKRPVFAMLNLQDLYKFRCSGTISTTTV